MAHDARMPATNQSLAVEETAPEILKKLGVADRLSEFEEQ